MNKNILCSLIIISIVFVFDGCVPKFDTPTPSAGSADFSKFIAVGGNYLSGYQDGALFRQGQMNSVPALMAKQFAMAGGGNFLQPLMPDEEGVGINFKEWESTYQSKSRLLLKINCEGVEGLSPKKTLYTAGEEIPRSAHTGFLTLNNFSIPYSKTEDIYRTETGASHSMGGNFYYHRFAGLPGSTPNSNAVNTNPTFFVYWTGMEDIYYPLMTTGSPDGIMSAAAWETHFEKTIQDLVTTKGAKCVVANIPDISTIAFFTTAPARGLDLDSIRRDSLNSATGEIFNYQIGKNGFAFEYPENSGEYRQMRSDEYLILTVPVDSIKCNKLGVFFGMPHRYVIDVNEVAIVRERIAAYNQIIKQKAQQHGLAFADMHAYFEQLKDGIMVNGAKVSSKFASGGFYSLDGYNPSQRGSAYLANEMLKAVNQKYGSTIPMVDFSTIPAVVFP